jgi:hypothetical protein
VQKVKIKADKNKNIISVSENNPEYGRVAVEQEVYQISDRGWLKSSMRTAFINGKMNDLQKVGYREGMELPGKIVIVESLTPFNTENPDANLKIAGKTGVICRYEDQPIYRQTFFTTNQNAFDEFVPHTNKEEIRDVMLAQKMMDDLEVVKDDVEL